MIVVTVATVVRGRSHGFTWPAVSGMVVHRVPSRELNSRNHPPHKEELHSE
jgi:hypothetical protein